MSGVSFSKLKRAKPSMRRRLFLYMGALAVLLLAALLIALLLLGQLKSPQAETYKSLTFQMGAFRADMTSLWRNVSVMGVHLSEDMTDLIEDQTPDFSALSGNVDAVEALQEDMLEPLCQYARQTDCSGAFVVLNTSLNTDVNSGSHSGLYVQRSNAEHTTGDLLLYRGMADVGRLHQVMPHRKWAQEFDLSDFPGFAEHLSKAVSPIERSCRTTALVTLPGTMEQAILLTVPMIGKDGMVYGLCGFSVNQTYFSAHHTQPAGISNLACILSDPANGLNVPESLLTYPAGGFCFVPDELMTEKNLRGGLTAFSGTDLSFVGISEPFKVAGGDTDSHVLTVLIPKSNYDRLLLKSGAEIAALLLMLVVFTVGCCLFYTRRYLRPVLRDIERLKEENCSSQMTFDELQPVSEKIRSHEKTMTVLKAERQDAQARAQQLLNEKLDLQEQMVGAQERLNASQEEVSRLAYLRKKELDPAIYDDFLEGYALLTDKELAVCDALVRGLTARQYAEQTGTAVSTVETHRKNIYKKTNIHSVKHLQICFTLMRKEQQMETNQDAKS